MRRPVPVPRGPLPYVAVATAGAGAALAFPPAGLWPLLPPALAVLTLAVGGARPRRAGGLGLVFGLGFALTLLPWIQLIGVDAWVGLSLLQAGFFALLGAALGRVRRLPGWPVWAACCWVAAESLRSVVPWGGFPWGRLAFASAEAPVAGALPWLGVAGTGFLVALAGTVLAAAFGPGGGRARRTSSRLGGLAVAAVLLLAPALLPLPATAEEGSVRIAAVQGNVPGAGLDAFSERRAVLDNHVRATRNLGERIDRGETVRPALVLWPENSTDIDPYADGSVYADIQGAVDAVGVPVLVGAMVGGREPVDVLNQGIVWEPGTGPADFYAKRHPVPFGEYIPHRRQLAALFERLDQIPRDMVAGNEPGNLDIAGVPVGDVICFEVAYDDVVHDVVEGGAQLLVVQTNNATYMGTGQVEQQFTMARLRALETGRWVAVVATNGVSGLVAPDGSVSRRLPVRSTEVLEADVTLRSGITPAVRWGGWLEVGLDAAALVAVLAGIVVARRRRVDPAPPAAAADPVGVGLR